MTEHTETTRHETIILAERLDEGPIKLLAESSKFDGASDRELAAALHIIQLHGFANEETGSVDVGMHIARIGRWILTTDSEGFVSSLELLTEEAAQIVFEKNEQILSDGLGGPGEEAEEEGIGRKFELTIRTGNTAMKTNADIARALRQAADKVEDDWSGFSIQDENGNTVGSFRTVAAEEQA